MEAKACQARFCLTLGLWFLACWALCLSETHAYGCWPGFSAGFFIPRLLARTRPTQRRLRRRSSNQATLSSVLPLALKGSEHVLSTQLPRFSCLVFFSVWNDVLLSFAASDLELLVYFEEHGNPRGWHRRVKRKGEAALSSSEPLGCNFPPRAQERRMPQSVSQIPSTGERQKVLNIKQGWVVGIKVSWTSDISCYWFGFLSATSKGLVTLLGSLPYMFPYM